MVVDPEDPTAVSGSVPSRTPVSVERVPPAVHKVLDDGGIDQATWRKTILELTDGHVVFYVRFAPHQQGTRHRHTSDTLYIFVEGSFSIPGEGTYQAGQVRWVPAGVAYGPERAGAEGCEFYFVSLGPFGTQEVTATDGDQPQ